MGTIAPWPYQGNVTRKEKENNGIINNIGSRQTYHGQQRLYSSEINMIKRSPDRPSTFITKVLPQASANTIILQGQPTDTVILQGRPTSTIILRERSTAAVILQGAPGVSHQRDLHHITPAGNTTSTSQANGRRRSQAQTRKRTGP